MPGMLLTGLMQQNQTQPALKALEALLHFLHTDQSEAKSSRPSMNFRYLVNGCRFGIMEDSRHNWLFDLLKVRSHEVTGLNQFHLLKRRGTAEHTAQRLTHCYPM